MFWKILAFAAGFTIVGALILFGLAVWAYADKLRARDEQDREWFDD